MAIGVLDKTGISNAVPVAAVDIHKEIEESIKQYRIQAVTGMVAASGLCMPCSAVVETTSKFATVVDAEDASTIVVADDVAKIVVIPYIASTASEFPATVKVAMFDVDAGTINKAEQFVGSVIAEKSFHETSGTCWYDPVIFDNVFMSNAVKFKCELPDAPTADLTVNFNVFVGGAAILLPEMDEYFSYVSLLVQPEADAADESTSISDFAGSTISLIGTTQVDTESGYPAIVFPTEEDRIVVPHRSEFLFTAEDFTIDGVLKTPATATEKYLCGHRLNDANRRGWSISFLNNLLRFQSHVDDDFAYPQIFTVNSPTMSLDTLYYYRITRESGIYRFDVGTEAGIILGTPVTPSYGMFQAVADLSIGTRSVFDLVSIGWSPEQLVTLRITNGIARTDESVPSMGLFPIVGVTP